MNKKGISPIIGMVLISAVLFSVMALFFIWRASQEEFQLQRERERIQQLKLVEGESIEFLTIPDGDLNGKNISIYNNGTSTPEVEHLYVNDTEISNFTLSWDPTNTREGTITVNETTATTTESVKIESHLGNLYPYSMPSAVIEILSIGDFGDDVRVLLDGSKSNAAGAVIIDWYWELFKGSSGTVYDDLHGARVTALLPKATSQQTWRIELTVTDNTDTVGDREHTVTLWFTAPGSEESGSGDGDTGFGGEGAPGGIYISLGGTGGGASIAEGRTIAFNIKNFSGRMIPLTSLRFYGVKSPSNYKCNRIYVAPVGKTLGAEDIYYDGLDIPDGGIAQFDDSYYLGDGDEAHIELTATGGGNPGDGDIFMVILYDAATPQSYYTVTIPIRTLDVTDDVVFSTTPFTVTASNTLQGKSLDLNLEELVSIGIAFSSPSATEPCDEHLIKFQIAGVDKWIGSVTSESTIEFSPALTWDDERTMRYIFDFDDVAQRFYYFVYRFSDGTSLAHKIPLFKLYLTDTATYPETQTVSSSAGGTATWKINVERIDELETPMDLVITGLPCYCIATLDPSSPVSMGATPLTVTLTITVPSIPPNAPWKPVGNYPIVITGDNNLNAYSCVIFLRLIA